MIRLLEHFIKLSQLFIPDVLIYFYLINWHIRFNHSKKYVTLYIYLKERYSDLKFCL